MRDYLRTLSDVGVGYYPNSSFVHLDVRDTNTYWVDYAGPGEAPRDTNKRDHDEEAEGDLRDPEVSEGDRPSEREAPTLGAPSAPVAQRRCRFRRCRRSAAPVAPARLRTRPSNAAASPICVSARISARGRSMPASSIGKRSTLPPARSASATKHAPQPAAQRTSPPG